MEEQKRLFEIVKSKIPDQLNLADEIEELLGLSKESAYRRIRGEKMLTFTELKMIYEKYNLSIDGLLGYKSEQNVSFQYKPVVISDIDNYAAYIKRLLEFMDNVAESPLEKELLFSAQDIPFYHFCKYPELAFFKLYLWNDTLKHNTTSFEKFCDSLQKDKILSIYERIYHAYCCIPTREIWTEQTVEASLRLLDYYHETGRFENRDTVLFLLDRFSSLIDTIKLYAEEGHKGSEKRIHFSLYSCSVDLENSLMLMKKDDQLMCVLRMYAISRIMTDNESLCSEIQKWMDNLITKSILISGDGAFKERFKFFQAINRKIQVLIEKVSLS